MISYAPTSRPSPCSLTLSELQACNKKLRERRNEYETENLAPIFEQNASPPESKKRKFFDAKFSNFLV